MKALLPLVVLATACTIHAQTSSEAMTGFVGTTVDSDSPIQAVINGPIGWTFQPLTDISVTDLGAFTYNLPSAGADVGLWSADGTLLASDVINSGSTLVNQSRYDAITPVALIAGQTYYLGEFSPAGIIQSTTVYPTESDGPDGYATMAPDIQLDGAAWQTNGIFEFPSIVADAPGAGIIAPNFEFQAAPEPATFALVTAGSLAALALRRRQAS